MARLLDLSDIESSAKANRFMQYFAVVLMALTVILLVWQYYGMEKILVFSARTTHLPHAVDDREINGASIASAERRGDKLLLTCQLIQKYRWPFCNFVFYTGKGSRGTDLSSYDAMSIDLRYHGPAPRAARAFIRNFEPEISKVGANLSYKVNEIEFVIPDSGTVFIPIKMLHVAHWWASERHIPMLSQDARIDNVMMVELTVPANAEMGQRVIELDAIRFHGKVISQNHLLMILVSVWIAFAMLWPFLRNLHLRAALTSSTQRLALLSDLNKALELEARELAGQAHTDPLTGALNRQGLRAALLKEWERTSLRAEPMAIIFFDIDHFKKVNDEHGHDVGDDVLRQFAETVRQEIRFSDKLVRWGGEEFLLVCRDTGAEQARHMAEKLRAAMVAQTWPKGLSVTASFGVAARDATEDIGLAIKRADVALYQAKSNGRNRVEIA